MSATAQDETASDWRARVAFALLALLYVALRLWRLTDSCLWFDEVFGVHAARHDGWGAMLGFVAADAVHPPLFYALLKLWVAAGGESLTWLRLLPVVLSAAALAPFLLLCRELRLKNSETGFALLLLALDGYLIKYAQEVRMYALLLPLALSSLWLFARFCVARRTTFKQLAALFVVNLLLIYTHYYGWLLILAELFTLAALAPSIAGARRKLVSFTASGVLLAACFAPWVYAVVRASAGGAGLSQNIGWVARPRLSDLAQFYFTLNELLYYQRAGNEPLYLPWSAPLGLLLFGLPLLLLFRRARRQDKHNDDGATHTTDEELLMTGENLKTTPRENVVRPQSAFGLRSLALLSVVAVALAFLLSHFLTYSVWGARHLIIVAAPYLLLAGVGVARLRPYWLKTAALILLGCWMFLNASLLLIRKDANYVWCAWEPLATRVVEAERMRAGQTKVYAFEEAVAYHVWFALNSKGEESFAVKVVKGVPGVAEDPAYFLPRGFNGVSKRDAATAFGEESFWVAFRDSSWRAERGPLKFLAARGYEVGEPFRVEAEGATAFVARARRASHSH